MATATSPPAPAKPGTEPDAKPGTKPGRRRGNAIYYWMVLPALVLFFVFHTIPVLQGIYYSLTDYRGYGSYDFVGLRNYGALLTDDQIWDSYLFTVQFAVIATLLTNVIALALALGLNARIRFRTTLRAIFFVPNVLAILIVGYVFQYFFTASLPAIGADLGIGWLSESLLADPDRAWIPIVIVAVWQAVAFNVIIFLAGLQTIPDDLPEAAIVDGAGPWQRFRSITLPLIMPFVTINMILALKNFLQVFDHIVALTNGGPGTATNSVSFLIYNMGFLGGEYAYQTANAVVYFALIVALSFFQLGLLRRREVTL